MYAVLDEVAIPAVSTETTFTLDEIYLDDRHGALSRREILLMKATERTEIEQERQAALERGERFGKRGLSNSSINHTLRHSANDFDEVRQKRRALDELLQTNLSAFGSFKAGIAILSARRQPHGTHPRPAA